MPSITPPIIGGATSGSKTPAIVQTSAQTAQQGSSTGVISSFQANQPNQATQYSNLVAAETAPKPSLNPIQQAAADAAISWAAASKASGVSNKVATPSSKVPPSIASSVKSTDTSTSTTVSGGGIMGGNAPAGTAFNPNVPTATPTPKATTTTGGTTTPVTTTTTTAPTSVVILATKGMNWGDWTRYQITHNLPSNAVYDAATGKVTIPITAGMNVNNLYSQQTDTTQPYYRFVIDQAKGLVFTIQANVYDAMTPQQQFNYMQSIGGVPSGATFVAGTGVEWSYTLPSTTSYNFVFTPTILNQIKADIF